MAAGVFMPSGTMCNLAAVLAHTRPGDELICDHQAHIVGTEAAGAAVFGGVAVRTIESPHGVFEPEQVRRALRPRSRTAPRSALLVVEQTTNFSGGAVWPLDQLRAVRDAAREAGLACHIDGARLLNACVASGTAAADYAAGWDSAWIDLTKGLGCPVGAVLCGSAAFVERAWEWKYRLGGAMRQSGILAAAGLHALDHHVDRLADDHANAALIWRRLAASGLFRFDPPQPASNILRFAPGDGRRRRTTSRRAACAPACACAPSTLCSCASPRISTCRPTMPTPPRDDAGGGGGGGGSAGGAVLSGASSGMPDVAMAAVVPPRPAPACGGPTPASRQPVGLRQACCPPRQEGGLSLFEFKNTAGSCASG